MDNSLSGTNTNSSRKKAVHDKTSYGIMATPPSPAFTSPSLTQSTSNTNSTSTPSTSPPPPATPPRSSRSRTRYPDLGRVPLHRRGTSKTYERLEDLLREAGYKETRVFTPEGERGESYASRDPQSSGDQHGGVRNSVGAFVGFLAGLIPNAAAGASTSSLGNADESYSPPVSPLTRRGSQKQKERNETPSSSEPHSPSPMTTSIESLEPTPRASRRMAPPSRSATPLPPPSIYFHSQSSQQDLRRPKHLIVHRASDQYSYTSSSTRRPLETRPSQTSLYYLSTRGSTTHFPAGPSHQHHHIVQPQPSRAGAYLRHMASAPNMPKRPNSTPAHHVQQHRKTLFLNDSDGDSERKTSSHEDEQPPLPRTWLESVARAVLSGGIGAYIGGPPDPIHPPSSHSSSTHTPSNSPTIRPKTLRPTRSSLSQVSPHQQKRANHLRLNPSPTPRTGLLDRTDPRKSNSGGAMLAPELFAQIGRGRARTSAGEVSRTRVVCRSAPASRSGSAVRGVGGDRKEKRVHEQDRDRGRARGRTAERDRVPSLANTRTEGDAWVTGKRARAKTAAGAENRYLSGWGVEADPESSDGERLSSSEEEGELNLAKMLVNPKRQASIKSLRKHLVDEGGASTSASSKLRKAAAGMRPRPHRSGSVRQSREDTDWDGSEAEEWGHGWVRKSARRGNSQDDDDDESFAGFRGGGGFGSGRSGTGRSRLGIPGPWSLIGGGGS